MEKQLDKFTFGKSEGAVYLVDMLNGKCSYRERTFILHKIHNFQKIMKELIFQHQRQRLSTHTVVTFIEQKRSLLDLEYCEIVERGYDKLIADLYCNVIIGICKQFQRSAMSNAEVVRSCETQLDQFKNPILQKRKCTFLFAYKSKLYTMFINAHGKISVIGKDAINNDVNSIFTILK